MTPAQTARLAALPDALRAWARENALVKLHLGQHVTRGLPLGHCLARLGAAHAVYTDGGGSTRLMDGRGTWRGSSENRRVATVLYAAAPAGSGALEVRDASGAPVGAGAGGVAARPDPAAPRVVGLSPTAKLIAGALGTAAVGRWRGWW